MTKTASPGPWRHNPDREVIVDANGNFVIYTTGVTSSNIGKITAASEMAQLLKELHEYEEGGGATDRPIMMKLSVLLAKIERGAP